MAFCVPDKLNEKDYDFLEMCIDDELFKSKKSDMRSEPFLKEGFDRYTDYLHELKAKIQDARWEITIKKSVDKNKKNC